MEHLCKVITAAQPSVQRGGRQKKHSQTQPLTHSLHGLSHSFFCNKVKGREASEGEKKQRDDRERKRKPSEMW